MRYCISCNKPATHSVFNEPVCADHILTTPSKAQDMVNHPPHYKDRVPGIECIEVTKHFKFTTGNAIKYIWRAGLKGDPVEDLKKAIWYLEQEIKDLGNG